MEWLRQNGWALIIAGATIISTFTLYGYRIENLEKEVAVNQLAIQRLNESSTNVQVSLAKIQTDIEYIKMQVTKLTK
jgi:uncharacterized coiled-coil protein SlyX